jgi:hypothetical protein
MACRASVTRKSWAATRLCSLKATARCASTVSRVRPMAVSSVSVRRTSSGAASSFAASARVSFHMFSSSPRRTRSRSSAVMRCSSSADQSENVFRMRCQFRSSVRRSSSDGRWEMIRAFSRLRISISRVSAGSSFWISSISGLAAAWVVISRRFNVAASAWTLSSASGTAAGEAGFSIAAGLAPGTASAGSFC